ncbi:hypothetical protein XENTR_v10005357 [Xenopus tropicalis]|nr:hypothetical protein XENTR_v10005357 [Xenopus tropicalis]
MPYKYVLHLPTLHCCQPVYHFPCTKYICNEQEFQLTLHCICLNLLCPVETAPILLYIESYLNAFQH